MTQGVWHRQRPHGNLPGREGPNAGKARQVKGRGRAGHRGRCGGREGATGRIGGGGMLGRGRPTPSPQGGKTLSPLLKPRRLTSRGGRAPPHKTMGAHGGGGGQDARPIRPRCPWHSHRPPAARMNASLRAGGRAAVRGRRAIVSSDLRESILPGQNARPADRGWPRPHPPGNLGDGRLRCSSGACRKALRVGKPPRESLALP